MSVGELMQFFHFYFFGNPEGLAFNGTRQDMGTSLVEPIAKAIERNGGKILTGVNVSEIHTKEGRIDALSYLQGDAQNEVPFWVERNQSMGEMESYGGGDRVFAFTPEGTAAISLTCTHQGCTVQREEDGKFHCPCHGSVFDREGRVEKGPATRDLPRFQVLQRQEEKLQLVAIAGVSRGAEGSEAERSLLTPHTQLQADYYVFATDVPGVQHLFSRIDGEVDRKARSQVEKLNIADPFAVCRFWFDRDFDWQHSNFTSLSGYHLTDSITLYHRIQEPYVDWAKRTGGSVVELHAYCYKEKDFPNQQALLATFERELYEIVPQLQQATMLHRELVNQKNFSGYPPNSYADRPQTSTDIPNLLFAGDWVKMPFPSGLMERAVSSGLLAANEIVHREVLQRRSLFSVHPEGVLKI
jgi:isorenieratene synthase